MADRDPRMGEAAAKTNTNLLTGRAVCGCGVDGCGSGMMTNTGKSGQYQYYACAARVKQGSRRMRWTTRPMDGRVPDQQIVGVFRSGDVDSFAQAIALNGFARIVETTPERIVLTAE